jgi:hypothetical protein
MIRYIAGLLVGATGALIGVYCAAALLPATREERPRDPLPGRRGVYQPLDHHMPHGTLGPPNWGTDDDTWTSGPIT